MRNIKIVLEYDGTRYQGWQRSGKDSNTGTVSEKLLDVIHRMTGEDIDLFCALRTEAGVHAAAQTVNFKTESFLSVSEMSEYLNHYLPQDIVVLSVEDMPERFHAGLNTKSLTYLYRIQIGPVADVFRRKFTCHLTEMPDIVRMKDASLSLIGKHDFSAFSSAKKKKGTVKELYSIDILCKEDELQFVLKGNDFLHQMPRCIIATLLDIGYGRKNVDCISSIFEKTTQASAPVPACGLCLYNVSW